MASSHDDPPRSPAGQEPARSPSEAAPDDRAVEVFAAVVDLVGQDRAVRLTEMCAGDAALARAVEGLLAAHDDPSPVLRSLVDVAPEVPGASAPAQATRIGPYDVLGVLGRGGMGIVYRAVQKKPRRTVALKVLSPARVDVESIERFEREIEVLGLLHHPGICRIYDAGAADLGLGLGEVLYFAMEAVHGVPVTQFAAQQHLDARACCALVAQICDAVHHAHRRGVIHRDLKPNNILVVAATDEAPAQPKVLDFGIARTLGADLPVAATRTGSLLGTLEYMSPEQLLGESHRVDARTDIYSLGVVLYELLTGRLPLALANQSLTETCRIVSEREPTPIGRIDKALRGDLEVIAAKALAKQRDDRYGSAAEFAEDLRHFVRGEPIVARRQTTLYHLRRFARRHRALVGGVIATLVALVAGLVAVTVLAQRNKQLANDEAGARALAEAAGERLRRALYGAQMRLCSNAFTTPGGVSRARDVLPAWQPQASPRAPDLRGFEWFLLDSMGHQAAAVHPCEPTPFDLWWLDGDDTLFSTHWYAGVFTDPETGRIIDRFDATVRPLAFSVVADDRSVIVQSITATQLAAIEPQTRARLRIFEHAAEVLRCALSPGGDVLAVNTVDGSVAIWQTRTGDRLFTLAGRHSAPLCFSRDGALFAAAGSEGIVRVWSTSSFAEPRRELHGPEEYLLGLGFDASGRTLATCSREGWLRLYDVTTGTQTKAIAHPAGLRRVAFSPRSARVAVACEDYAAYVFDPDTGVEQQLCGHAGIVGAVAFSPSGDRLATMSDDGTLRVWDLTQSPPVRAFATIGAPAPHEQMLLWSADGGSIAVRGTYGGCTTVALGSGKVSDRFAITVMGGRYEVRLNGKSLDVVDPVAGFSVGSIVVDALQEIAAHAAVPVIAIGERGALRLWRFLADAAPIAVPIVDVCRGLAWMAGGDKVVVVDGSDVVQVFDVMNGERVASHAFPQGALELDCAPRGDAIAIACVDQVIRIWSPSRGVLATLTGHAAHVQAVAWSPDGRRLASGGQDRQVKVFDVDDGAELLTLPHDHPLSAVAWSPDGERLATLDVGGRLKIWDATVGYARERRRN